MKVQSRVIKFSLCAATENIMICSSPLCKHWAPPSDSLPTHSHLNPICGTVIGQHTKKVLGSIPHASLGVLVSRESVSRRCVCVF